MNYHLHYNKLIERAKTREITGYYEKHHVVPRCLGGLDIKENLVNLTPEEHYVAHQLLVKMHPGNFALIKAAHMMSVHHTSSRVGNKKFGWLRRAYSEAQKQYYSNKENHPKGMKGKQHSQEHRDKLRNYAVLNAAKTAKKVYQWDKYGNLVTIHNSLSEAAKSVKSSPSNIKKCCEGGFSQVKTYLWSFTNKCPSIPKEVVSGSRKVHTEAGVFESVTAAVKHFGFTSTKQVRYRCQRNNFPEWYYLD